jgi:malonyl-CoA O-methyltransferase
VTDRDRERPQAVLDPAAAYARWAASYPPHAHNALMLTEERAVLACLPADLGGSVVLDAGCGSGRYMLHALRRGAASVVGVDLSREMLARAGAELAGELAAAGPRARAARGPGSVALLQGTIEALPLQARSADLTICALTIGHVASLEKCLAELQRVTRRGGRIVCSDFHPSASARGERREFSAAGRRYAVRHIAHELSDWQRACAALGLRIVRTLEPRLDPADVADRARLAASAFELPVALVLELG